MCRKLWTESEIKILETEYPSKGSIFVANKTGRSRKSVIKMANKLNIKSDFKLKFASKEEILHAIKCSNSVTEVLRNLNKSVSGVNVNLLKKYCIDLGIELVFKKNSGGSRKKKNINEWLISGSTITSSNLKEKIYHEGLKQPICEMCGQDEDWNGMKISMILDHINGVNDDNRLENLRILCPNCNAGLPTHCRGYKKIYTTNANNEKKKSMKIKSHEKYNISSMTDNQIESSLSQRKSVRPPYEQLLKEIEELGYVGVGRKYGVSDNAIRKWKKNYEKYNKKF